jgi:hypothetical protein
MTGKDTSRGGWVTRWIEKHCWVPLRSDRGKMLRLLPVECEIIHRIYDAPDGLHVADCD